MAWRRAVLVIDAPSRTALTAADRNVNFDTARIVFNETDSVNWPWFLPDHICYETRSVFTASNRSINFGTLRIIFSASSSQVR